MRVVTNTVGVGHSKRINDFDFSREILHTENGSIRVAYEYLLLVCALAILPAVQDCAVRSAVGSCATPAHIVPVCFPVQLLQL